MSEIVVPGNMLLGATISIDHATANFTEQDIIKLQQTKIDFVDPSAETYIVVPKGKTIAVDFNLPEKAFVERVRVYYAPEGFATFGGQQEIQPVLCYINRIADDTPFALRDSDFGGPPDATFRDPALTTPKLTDGLNKNYTTSGWTSGNPDYAFQTGHAWNSVLVDFGAVKPISQFRLYSPYFIYVDSSGWKTQPAFAYWYQDSSKHGEIYASLDGIKFVNVTDKILPNTSIRPVVLGFTGWRGEYGSQNEKTCAGYFNNTNGQQPLFCRYLKFNQNGARWANKNPVQTNNSYGITELDMYQYFSQQHLVSAVYFRDSELINICQQYDGYKQPDPTNNPSLRYQDIFVNDITDKIRITMTAHPSWDTWFGGMVARGSYAALNFGRGADNEIDLLDAPVGVPGTAQPIIINNSGTIPMTQVEVTPQFEVITDLQEVLEISIDGVTWNAIFKKYGYAQCRNDTGTECAVGNPDKQYVFKCNQGFQGQCSAYEPLFVSTDPLVLSTAGFLGDPKDGVEELKSWDGNNATSWISANLGTPDPDVNAWKYNIGALKYISHVIVRVLGSNHTIEFSKDNSVWELSQTVISGGDRTFKVDDTYQYIRIYAPISIASDVAEITVFESLNVFKDQTFILIDTPIQTAGVLNDLWYSIGYIPYGETGQVEIYILRPNGANYDLLYSSDLIQVDSLDIFRHLVDRQVLVQPGDLIAIYAENCTPQLKYGIVNNEIYNGRITASLLQSAASSFGYSISLNAKAGILLNVGDIDPSESKTVLVRTNIPSTLALSYERYADLVVLTRVNI